MQIPLFPLSNIVMPGGLLPLRLFEQRYIDMIKECFKTDSGFGVCLIKDGAESGEPAKPYPMGTYVRITDFDQGADGLLHITTFGEAEFTVLSYTILPSGLLMAEVTMLEQQKPATMTPEVEILADKLSLIIEYVEANIQFPEKRFDDADWVCYRLIELLPIGVTEKFELQQLHNNDDRLSALVAMRIEIGAA